MKISQALTLRLAAIGSIVVISISVFGQASSAASPPSIAASITVDKYQVPIGQSPWAILTVKNLTDHEVALHGWMYRAHVDGENGEPPTTLVQRMMTGKLLPGDRPLREDESVVPVISPGKSYTLKFELAYLYDLRAPGKYAVYLEVMDPVSQKWLRTDTASFEMQVSTR